MLSNNPLLAQLKQQLHAETPRVTGVVKATDKGFGFLEAEDGQSYFVPPPMMKKVVHGDRVEAVVHVQGEKKSVEPETLVEPSLERFIGRVRRREGRLGVVPDHPSINLALNARAKRGIDEAGLEEGDWVVARLLRHPLRPDDRSFLVQIEELISRHDQPNVPWRVTLARHVLEYASPVDGSECSLRDEGLEREDLTALPFFTIDSRTTRDMDDALHIEAREEGGWRLRVAIADPTAFVAEDDAVDQEARRRAFTVYLPGQNVTMLPERLADDLCSLRENETRAALACTLEVAADGELLDYRFYAAEVRSHAQLAYDDVSDWIEGKGEWKPVFPRGEEQLRQLADFTEARSAWRSRNAIVFKDRPDYAFELDAEGRVLAVRTEPRRIANRMVEESMIAANVCCARLLGEEVGHGIFNVHLGFAAEKLDHALAFLAEQSIEASREQLTDLDAWRALRYQLDERDDAWLEARLRRFQGYTAMTAAPGPHFGMGLPAYATWTSPIRKYGDMINHRLIKALLLAQARPASASETLTAHLSERRKLNRMAERDVKDWLYVRHLAPAVGSGQRFEAEIVDIRRGGLRVRLNDNGASVFVPASTLEADREALVIDDKEGVVSVRGEQRYRLGDIIEVVLSEAREETRSLIGRPVS
ncbi:exoribonuclease II [Halotalea alkalilenta]|uniref:Exoribonuclease 2 n=1 Tax=Halotalea alkalilenta TaxID=376489 RepID=A0A172YGT7_9GAMM|nr:exoribonuclease II [Halotalea alkalilenta]ANF58443.1 exoribonuclease II [Halotalea alkalilenta]